MDYSEVVSIKNIILAILVLAVFIAGNILITRLLLDIYNKLQDGFQDVIQKVFQTKNNLHSKIPARNTSDQEGRNEGDIDTSSTNPDSTAEKSFDQEIMKNHLGTDMKVIPEVENKSVNLYNPHNHPVDNAFEDLEIESMDDDAFWKAMKAKVADMEELCSPNDAALMIYYATERSVDDIDMVKGQSGGTVTVFGKVVDMIGIQQVTEDDVEHELAHLIIKDNTGSAEILAYDAVIDFLDGVTEGDMIRVHGDYVPNSEDCVTDHIPILAKDMEVRMRNPPVLGHIILELKNRGAQSVIAYPNLDSKQSFDLLLEVNYLSDNRQEITADNVKERLQEYISELYFTKFCGNTLKLLWKISPQDQDSLYQKEEKGETILFDRGNRWEDRNKEETSIREGLKALEFELQESIQTEEIEEPHR